MAHYRVLVQLQMDSGIPEDKAVNVWHCDALSLPNGYEDFVDDLVTFYQAIDGSLMSSALNTTGHSLTVYRMSDDPPRAPVYTLPMTLTPTSAALPPELAVCLSFQGERVSGQSQSRRRGRVYIGPLGSITASSTNPEINSTNVGVLVTAATALLVASNASITYKWCVYSTVDSELVEVTNGWVDNAFDVQRRRGLTATSRSTFV